MEVEEGGPPGPSYSFVIAPELGFKHFKRPPFEIPAEMKNIIWEDELSKEKPMEIDPKTNHPKAALSWEPGKCILQAPVAPKYTINSPKIEDQKQYMKDFALIRKFMGLWP
jgi:hypothetical protein